MTHSAYSYNGASECYCHLYQNRCGDNFHGTAPSGPYTILIVEDHEATRLGLVALLTNAGLCRAVGQYSSPKAAGCSPNTRLTC